MRRYTEYKQPKEDDSALRKWLENDRVNVQEFFDRNSPRKKNKTKKDGK